MLDVHRHYCARFCEENVWRLCQALPPDLVEPTVVFISNATRSVAIWQQRDSTSPDAPLLWDYHVVLLARQADSWQVYDADSRLPSPCPAPEYLDRCFRLLPEELARYRPRFRLVAAEQYARIFASDRSHMKEPDGRWLSPPPNWQTIGDGHNLMKFVDIGSDFVGRVCTLEELAAHVVV